MSIRSSDLATDSSFKTGWWTQRLLWPLIVAAVVRLGLLAAGVARMGVSALLSPDTSSYLIPGRNLVLHGRYFADGAPDLFRTPGYPLFLGFFSLAGLHAAAVANVILSVFSVILVWRLGRAVCGNERVALIAAWLFALEPVSVAMSVSLLSETLFLALFLIGMERVAVFFRGSSLRALAVAGLSLAAAAFVRPVAYYLPVVIALGAFLVMACAPGLLPRRQGSASGASQLLWKAPAVLLLSAMPWLAAWQMRNWAETGYSGFTSMREVNLYIENAAEVRSIVEHRSYFDIRNELGFMGFTGNSGQVYLSPSYLERHPWQAGWSQTERIAYMRSEAERVLQAHRGIYLRTCLHPAFTMVFDPGAGYFDHILNLENPKLGSGLVNMGAFRWGIFLVKTYSWIAAEKAVFGIVLLGLYFFAVRGIFRGGLPGVYLGLMLGTAIYFIVVSGAAGGFGSDARYRLPVMPIVCILAAAGFRRYKKRRQST